MSDNIQIREIEAGDIEMIASAFQAIGWNKSESQYRNYLKEQEEGKRMVLVAFSEGKFAGYGNIIWSDVPGSALYFLQFYGITTGSLAFCWTPTTHVKRNYV